MSEKRFTLHLPRDEKDGTMGYIVDHCNKTTYFIRGENARKDLVNLLNELAEENEQLKYDNFMFKEVIKTFQKVAISERKKLERQVDEPQTTIRKLQDLCGESDGENAKLRIENKKLKAKLREKEEDEQLYANEILELREANKEFIQFKELGGDY